MLGAVVATITAGALLAGSWPATAFATVCADGWVSGSVGSGTCSHHGGIAHGDPRGGWTPPYFVPKTPLLDRGVLVEPGMPPLRSRTDLVSIEAYEKNPPRGDAPDPGSDFRTVVVAQIVSVDDQGAYPRIRMGTREVRTEPPPAAGTLDLLPFGGPPAVDPFGPAQTGVVWATYVVRPAFTYRVDVCDRPDLQSHRFFGFQAASDAQAVALVRLLHLPVWSLVRHPNLGNDPAADDHGVWVWSAIDDWIQRHPVHTPAPTPAPTPKTPVPQPHPTP
jgi:hypothetical protein